jgi:hypothetical protein
MWIRTSILICGLAALSYATIIDRVAIVAGNSIIKDSDITRDIRLTDFLNGDPLDLGLAVRKTATSRLIDQVFIRREIRIGDYPTATVEAAEKQIASVTKSRFKTEKELQAELARYGLSEADLRLHVQWQLTVLQFIDARFKPAAYVSDEEVATYIKSHQAELERQHPGKTSPDDLRADVQMRLSAEKVNQLFFAWLDEQRKTNQIRYLEDSLK